MKHAVFFRNLNLGRPNCPDRALFEQAFLEAGATEARSFLSNGTLVFGTRPRASAEKLLSRASAHLRAACGLREPGFLRPLPALAALAAGEPFAGIDRTLVYECCVSFLAPGWTLPAGFVPATPRGEVEILRFTDQEAFSLCRQIGRTPGSPNAFLEKWLQRPATTRAWNTVLRLLDQHG